MLRLSLCARPFRVKLIETHILRALAVLGLLLATASEAAAATVTATWDRNPESNIAGYILSYGTQSGTHPTSIDVGNVLTKQLTLTVGRYFFVVQAYNTASQLSPKSAEVSIDLTVPPITPNITSISPTSGVVGTSVTINGANFGTMQGTSSVRFNGTVATPTSWTATSIVATVPAGATSGPVTVTVGGVVSNGLGFTVPSASNITLLQHRSIDGGTTTTASLSFTANNSAGNFIAVVVRVSGTAPAFTVTDTRANTYRRAVQFSAGSDHTGAIYYAENVAGGSNTVRVVIPDSRTLRLAILEYSGIATTASIDGFAASQGFGTNASSGNMTVTANGDLLIGAITSPEDVNMTAGAGYTIRQSVPALPSAKLVVEDRILAGAGPVSASATLSAARAWGAAIAAFKKASGASNLAPTLTQPANQINVENAPISLPLVGTDPEGAPLTYSATGLPASLSVNPTSGVISGRLTSSSAGSYSVTATVSDGSLTNSKTFTWTVRNPARLGDFDGDGRADVTVYRPSSHRWRVLKSAANYSSALILEWGASSVIPVVGDFDGDGANDMTYYRPSTGTWSILKSSSNFTLSQSVTLGTSTDVPVAGDYDGDGRTDVAVFRPTTGQWQILKSSTNYTTDFTTVWGVSGDRPVPGDYDGDGRTDLAVYRPSNAQWRVLQSSTDYAASFTVTSGSTGDITVPADYDGDGRTDVATYRPSNGTWSVLKSSDNYSSSFTVTWGTSSYIPVPADFDGDGKADLGLFRSGQWRIRLSNQNYTTSMDISWGRNGDIPLPKHP